MKIKYLAITALAAAAALAGCSVPGGWSVDGIVEEAPEGMKLIGVDTVMQAVSVVF